MPADEVTDLKSEILFGSSHCSCSSCDTLRCFAKRNSIANDCRCSICKEPTTCLYNLNKEPINIAVNAVPSKESQKTNEKLSASKRYTRRNTKRNLYGIKNIINVNVDSKNVMIQTQPQRLDDASVKHKDEVIQPQCRDDDTTNTLIDLITQFVNSYNSISMQDVVDKITEVCKICSCKVCKCIITTRSSDKCDCKPCECADCKSVLMQINSGIETKNDKKALTKKISFFTPVSSKHNKLQAFTYDGDKRDENYLSMNPNGPCKCKPCDCDQCKIYNVNINDDGRSHNLRINIPRRCKTTGKVDKVESKRCICKTFQRGECSSMFEATKSVIVAPVEEYPRNNLCACSPCDCNNCRQNRSSASNSGVREISTAMLRHSNCQCEMCLNQACRQTVGSCRCGSRNNVISKPFKSNKQNIDIHSALVKKKKSKQRCTISVLTDVLLSHRGKNVKVVTSDCGKGKLTCDDKKEPSVSASTSYYHITSLSTVRINDRLTKKCQCNPCECKICEKFKMPDRGVWKSERFRSKCNCEICSCLYCGDLLQYKDVGDSNRNDELSINIYDVNKSCNKDRSVYLALLHDVYSKTNITEGNRDVLRSYLFSDEPSRLQYARKSSFHSALSISRTHELEKCSTQMPENKLYEPYEKHFRNNYQFKDNTIVATFVNKITKIDGMNDLNFYVKDLSSRDRLGKETPNSYQSIVSFSEKLDNNLKCTIKKISNARTENCDEAKKGGKTTQNVCKTQKLLSTEDEMQNKCNKVVRECFRKTNLASKNDAEENHDIGKLGIFEEISTHSLVELGSNKLNDGFVDESNDQDVFQTDVSNFQQCNILFKAKLLTCELLKMLFQYQKANKEFKSVRQTFKFDTHSHLNSDSHSIYQKEDDLHEKNNVRNLDLKFSSAKVVLQSDTHEADDGNIRKSSEIFLNKKEFPIEHHRSFETEQSKSNSSINKDVAKNENVELVSEDLVVNEFSNITRNELQRDSQLTTFCSKIESRVMLNSRSAELNKFFDDSWGLNKTDESLNLKKIKYVDIDNIDKYKVFNKKRYVLIENIALRSEQYDSEISEPLLI